MLAYSIVATTLVVGSLYALAHYAEMGAPPASRQAARVPTTPAAQAPRPSPSIPASLPRLVPAPPENVVRTSTKTYYLPPANPAQADADTFNALRRNCYDAARNNSQGQYPAMQQSACGSFASFARSKGWDTGPLPAYGTPSPQPQLAYQEGSEPDNSMQCGALYNEEQEIEAAMRAGYQEPRGNLLRARLAEVEEQLWRLHCPKR